MIRIFALMFIILVLNFGKLHSKKFIANIFIDRKEVFDSTQKDWFFAAKLANSLHSLTRQYIIEDELLFSEDQEMIFDSLYETERNLRNTGLFSDVKIEFDSSGEYYNDVYITTQDRWSTIPTFIFGTGGNTTNIGGGFEELNLLGTGTRIRFEGFHRSENEIGWQGGFLLNKRRLFRSEFMVEAAITANSYRTDQSLTLGKPFRTLSTKWSYGIYGLNSYGRDFLYSSNVQYGLMPFHERELKMWISRCWLKDDRVFMTVLVDGNDVNRGKPEFSRVFDNSGKFLISFSSVSQDFFQTEKLNSYQKEDVPIGGWGTAVLGKIFPIGSEGESYYYIAAQGEKSYLVNDLYVFAQVTGASAFSHSSGYYTYQEAMAKAFYRINPNLLITSRLRQQTVWNWSDLRQLILDNDGGLRGYSANSLSGDNRIVFNTELRFFPDFSFWIFKLGLDGFWDIGTVWNQERKIYNTQWHNSIGLGLRFYNTKATGDDSIFRLDFAFNFDKQNVGIVFTTNQLFSVFEKHQYKLPQVYGTEFDYQ